MRDEKRGLLLICCVILTLCIGMLDVDALEKEPVKQHRGEKLSSFVVSTKAGYRMVGFTLDHSMAGSFLGNQNVIIENLFDAVPSYNGAQSWKTGNTRSLMIKPGSMVKIAGVFKYRNIFGAVSTMEFSRDVYVPTDSYLVVVR